MSTIVNNRRTASSTKGRQPAAPSRNFVPKKNSLDKPVPTEGVYGDARFTHVVFTLVGTTVQVLVKNGKIYEGIFKTISPQMDVVLEVAHLKMQDSGSSCSAPTRDMILEKVIFKKDDVVSVTCLSVDLDYAVKDTFTDAAINRGNNGNTFDVELQPWDGEAGEEIGGGGLEEGESANGWDVNEMFKTNQEQFSVKSSYDENLSQYTTVLNKSDTKEFRKREEDARRIAREIERSEDYRKHIDLENGDDEEALFSSVHRPSSSTTNQSGEKKYIPPQRRNNNNMTKGQGNNGVDNGSFQQVQRSNHNKHRQSGVQHHQHQLSPSPQHHPPPSQQTHSPQHSHQSNYPPRHQQQQQPLVHQQQHQQVKATVVHVTSPPGQQQTTQATSNKEEQNNKLNGQENSGTAQDRSTAKPTSQSGVSSPVTVPLQQQQQQQPESNDSKRPLRQPVNKNTKTAKIDELKEFQDQFKLENQKESDRKTATVEIDNKPTESENKTVDNSNNDNKRNERLDVQPREEDMGDQVESGEQSGKVTPAKSLLNPNAKIFTMPSSSPARVHPTQSPTPPRPQAQSPVVMPTTYFYLPQQPPVTRPYQQTKKAVTVSAYPNQDFRQAAQHATGQPLLAGTLPPQQYLPYMMSSQMIQQQQGYTMMNQHARMMNPAAMGPSSTTGMDPNQANSQQIYMSQPGPHAIQAHMTQQALQQSQQHVAHQPGAPQTPGVQMTQVTGHHPAPSPVQHVQGQGNHPGQVPPTAGTPQPLNYPQISLQGHHIHGSHNPTSPQTIHASNPYNSHPQFTYSQGQPTSVSHAMSMSMPSQMSSQAVPIYMMQPPPSNQVQQHQFQTHMPGAPIPGQGGHIMHHGVSGQGQVQYVPHVPPQGPQVLQYTPGQ